MPFAEDDEELEAATGLSESDVEEAEEFPEDMHEQLARSTEDARRYMWGWALCERFLAGDQFLTFSPAAATYVTAPQQPGKNSVCCNIIKPIYRAKMAQLSMAYPDVAVAPESPAFKDIRKATAAEEVLHACWHEKKVQRVLQDATGIATQTGTSAIHTYFDPFMGDFAHEAKRPYDIRFQPGAVNDHECEWMAIRSIIPRVKVIATFPDKEEDISEVSQTNDIDRWRNIGSIDPVPDDSCEVYDIYWKDGRHALFTGQTYLWTGRTPQNVVPVQIIRYQKYEDRIWGDGLIWSLIDIQQAYNRVLNRTLDMVEAMSNPLWWVPVGSGVLTQALSNIIGGFIAYNPAGGEPKRERGVDVPPHMFEMLKALQMMAQDVAEIHNQSMGKRAVGTNSGKAIDSLVEQDTLQTRITMDTIEDAVVDLARVQLAFISECWPEKRMVRIFDVYGKAVYKSLGAEDIATTPSIHIAAGSLFHSDIKDREKKLFELAGAGAIPWDQAIKRSTMRNFNEDRMHTLQDNFHAAEVLEWAKNHLPFEITPDDPIESIRDVFQEYIRSPDYWNGYVNALAQYQQTGDGAALAAEKENMDYIHEVFVNLQMPIGADPMQIQAATQAKIYPRQPMPNLTGNVPQPGNPNPQTGPMDPQMVQHRQQVVSDLGGKEQNRAGVASVGG